MENTLVKATILFFLYKRIVIRGAAVYDGSKSRSITYIYMSYSWNDSL